MILITLFAALYRVARDWTGLAMAAGLRQDWEWYLSMSAVALTQMACPDPVTGVLTCIPDVSYEQGAVYYRGYEFL